MGLLDCIGLILFVGVEQDTLMKERADAAAHQKENLPLAAFVVNPEKGIPKEHV